MVAPECPRPEVLRAYAVGNLPEVEGEAVMQHLETCPACEATIASLGDSSDTLVNALARSRCDDPFLLEPELGPMLARVQSIGVNLGDEARSAPGCWGGGTAEPYWTVPAACAEAKGEWERFTGRRTPNWIS